MAIQELHIIGESINDSVPSTHAFFEANDFDSVRELARFQEEKGARCIDVNVGSRSALCMEKAVQAVLEGTSLPLSIDSPDPNLAHAGLQNYDVSRGKPILNSISPLRTEMFDLLNVCAFRPILLISEMRRADGTGGPCRTAEETFAAAVSLFEQAKAAGVPNEDIIFDPGIAPIGSDTDGNLTRLLQTLKMIADCPDMKGVHASVGLSNFTVMLPSKTTKTGVPVKGPLESAFLTLAMPLGLDYVIGSVRRNYQILDENDPALLCVRECAGIGGFESLMRVRSFYRG